MPSTSMHTDPAGTRLPIPDPTPLTTEALHREIKALREVLETRIGGQDDLITAIQDGTRMRRADVTAEVMHSQQLLMEKFNVVDEKFQSVQTQFTEIDKRHLQTSAAAKDAVSTASLAAEKAVSAAFQAAKEAVAAALSAAKESSAEQNKSASQAIDKSEKAQEKTMDMMIKQSAALKESLDDKISSLVGRLNSLDGRMQGGASNKNDERAVRAETRANVSMLIAGVLAMITIASTMYSLSQHSGPVSMPLPVSAPSVNAAPPQVVVVPVPATPAK